MPRKRKTHWVKSISKRGKITLGCGADPKKVAHSEILREVAAYPYCPTCHAEVLLAIQTSEGRRLDYGQRAADMDEANIMLLQHRLISEASYSRMKKRIRAWYRLMCPV